MSASRSWDEFKFGLSLLPGDATHPRFGGSKTGQFSATSYESTEIEYLEMLHSLVLALKPLQILETGTDVGTSTIALGYGLRYNAEHRAEPGVLHTIDADAGNVVLARQRIASAGLDSYVVCHQGDTLKTIREIPWTRRFDFVFFDSSRRSRGAEYRALKDGEFLETHAVLVFHDTCGCPIKDDPNDQEIQQRYLAEVEEITAECSGVLRLPHSRGLTIGQLGNRT
jgi:predicted O-methyltransferase YrrM